MQKVNKKMAVTVAGTLGFDYIMDFPGKFADRIMPDKIHKISLSPESQSAKMFLPVHIL